MPSFSASSSGIPPVPVPFTISSVVCGSLTRITFPIPSIPRRKSPKSRKVRCLCGFPAFCLLFESGVFFVVINYIDTRVKRPFAPNIICLCFIQNNKNEYFDLLQTTQYSGGYIRWIKFFVDAVGKAAKRSAQLLIQYEAIVAKDKKHLKDIRLLPKSVWIVYDYLKLFPVTSITRFKYLSVSARILFRECRGKSGGVVGLR